jgi:hypothetical protein
MRGGLSVTIIEREFARFRLKSEEIVEFKGTERLHVASLGIAMEFEL